jgi:DNA-directed RNA polymerase specialized sigma subunit
MQQDYPCDTNFKTLSLAEKTVFALYYFRSFSVNQIVEVLHLSNPIIEKLLRSAEVKAK